MIQCGRKTPGVILTAAVVMLMLLVGCSTTSGLPEAPTAPRTPVARVGETAPDFQLQDLEGNTITLSDLRGRPIMLNFWATWCPPCRDEMPLIQQIYEEWTGKPPSVVVLTIDMGESQATVERFMQSQGLSMPVLLDIKQDVAGKYNIAGIPTTFFIDADGVIQDKKIGAFWSKEQIESYLDKIIP